MSRNSSGLTSIYYDLAITARIYMSRNSSGLTSHTSQYLKVPRSTGVEIQVVLRLGNTTYGIGWRSTGVEIQVVLRHVANSFTAANGSTGVEIQVVLRRNICKYQ